MSTPKTSLPQSQPQSQSQSQSRSSTGRHSNRSLVLLVAVGALAGLLLWAKLRLVSNMPRSVYADPHAAQPAPHAPPPSKDHAAGAPAPAPASQKGEHADSPSVK